MTNEDKKEKIQSIAYRLIEFVIDETSRNSGSKNTFYKYEYATQICGYIGNLSDINIDTLFDVVSVTLNDTDDYKLHRVMMQIFGCLEITGFEIETSSKYEVVDFYEDNQDAESELIEYCLDDLKNESPTLI